jgi:hypothetical protein
MALIRQLNLNVECERKKANPRWPKSFAQDGRFSISTLLLPLRLRRSQFFQIADCPPNLNVPSNLVHPYRWKTRHCLPSVPKANRNTLRGSFNQA